MMAHLLTNELASGLNWARKKHKEQAKQKRPFKELALDRSMFGKSCYIFNHHHMINSRLRAGGPYRLCCRLRVAG